MLDGAREGLLALDEQGTIVEANAAAAAILGEQREQLLGRQLVSLIAPADRAAFTAARAALDGEELRLVVRGVPASMTMRAAGRRQIAVSITRPQRDLESFALRLPFGVVGIEPDLRVAFANASAAELLGPDLVRTGSSLAEGAPRELATVVRGLVDTQAALRTTALDLADGRRFTVSGLPPTAAAPALLFLADATEQHSRDQVVREFLRNAAHQLRTPLAGIAVAVETLQSGAKNDPAARDIFLGHLETHVGRLSRIARGLLLLARAGAGEVVTVDAVELRPLIDEIVAGADARDGVPIVVDCPDGLAALASPDLLYETVIVLVENAVRHTLEGEVRIAAAERDGRVVLTVSDSGPGIPAEFQDRVFEPFFRAPAAAEGFGLGLAIAAQAVATMRGGIEVSSPPGAGTTFTVTLPAATVGS